MLTHEALRADNTTTWTGGREGKGRYGGQSEDTWTKMEWKFGHRGQTERLKEAVTGTKTGLLGCLTALLPCCTSNTASDEVTCKAVSLHTGVTATAGSLDATGCFIFV
jgi:hypothetical protein